jgi:hypothetical protein
MHQKQPPAKVASWYSDKDYPSFTYIITKIPDNGQVKSASGEGSHWLIKKDTA